MTQDSYSRAGVSISLEALASITSVAKLVLPALLLSYTAVTWATTPAYDYKVFARPGDVIDGVTLDTVGSGFVADDGTVVFVGHYNSCCDALFSKRSAAGPGKILVRQGDSIGGVSVSRFGSVSQNDNGEVVFSATINNSSSQGIFRLKAAIALPGQTIEGFTLTSIDGSVGLSDSGEVAFDGVSGSLPNAVFGILTPQRVIVKSGDMIGGFTLQTPQGVTLAKNGVVAFNSSFTDPQGQSGLGVFTQHRLVARVGDTVGGLPVLALGGSRIGETGGVGFGFDYSLNFPAQQAVAVDGAIAVKSGDVIDGLTIVGQPDGIPFGFRLNAHGEVLFETFATDSTGASVFGLFTQHHLVAGRGNKIAGLTAQSVGLGSINDAGQIAFPLYLDAGLSQAALIVATPKGN